MKKIIVLITVFSFGFILKAQNIQVTENLNITAEQAISHALAPLNINEIKNGSGFWKDKAVDLGNMEAYKLKAIPNPANNNFVAEYDLADKTNGKIIIKDAITGLEMQTIVLDPSQKSIPINAGNLQQGNYILELQGDNTYLKSEHLMVY